MFLLKLQQLGYNAELIFSGGLSCLDQIISLSEAYSCTGKRSTEIQSQYFTPKHMAFPKLDLQTPLRAS